MKTTMLERRNRPAIIINGKLQFYKKVELTTFISGGKFVRLDDRYWIAWDYSVHYKDSLPREFVVIEAMEVGKREWEWEVEEHDARSPGGFG